MFNYDWFHGASFQQQKNEARRRCLAHHYPDQDMSEIPEVGDFRGFFDELQLRALIYLRDGFSYEIKDVANVGSKSHLVFECEPVDDQYKVGAFVVTVPFEEIVRVEVFAVHPSEKPEELPQITGFRNQPEMPPDHRNDHRPDHRHEAKPGKKGR